MAIVPHKCDLRSHIFAGGHDRPHKCDRRSPEVACETDGWFITSQSVVRIYSSLTRLLCTRQDRTWQKSGDW